MQPERLAITDTAVQDLLASGVEQRILPVGSTAPEFALPDALTGKLVRSSDLLAVGPLIVNFFRGRWCPYCMTELEAWQAFYPQVREAGALVVAISPQLPRQNDFTVQQHNLTFPILSDAGAAVAALFGVTYRVTPEMQAHYRSILINIPFVNGDHGENTWRLPLPATFVIATVRQSPLRRSPCRPPRPPRPDGCTRRALAWLAPTARPHNSPGRSPGSRGP